MDNKKNGVQTIFLNRSRTLNPLVLILPLPVALSSGIRPKTPINTNFHNDSSIFLGHLTRIMNKSDYNYFYVFFRHGVFVKNEIKFIIIDKSRRRLLKSKSIQVAYI